MIDPRELVGTWPNIRMAGADPGASREITELRRLIQSSLHVLLIVVLGRLYLGRVHERVCDFIQSNPGECLLLMARDHCKSTIVSQGLPIHILIQEPEGNVYFPGEWGSEQRILILGSGDKVVTGHLESVRLEFEQNTILRKLFPHVCWSDPKRPGGTWNNSNLVVPRTGTWPNPSVGAMTVNGNKAGWRPSCLIFDDVISENEAKSEAKMADAVNGYTTADALVGRKGLQWTIGTPWTPQDLYQDMREDPAVVKLEIPCLDVAGGWRNLDEAFERGRLTYPEGWTKETLRRRREKWAREKGTDLMFSLMMMLDAKGSGATDFGQYRPFRAYEPLGGVSPWEATSLVFEEDERDQEMVGLYG